MLYMFRTFAYIDCAFNMRKGTYIGYCVEIKIYSSLTRGGHRNVKKTLEFRKKAIRKGLFRIPCNIRLSLSPLQKNVDNPFFLRSCSALTKS